MARYKPYDYNQMNMIPVSLDKQLVPGTLEYAIHYIIEEHLNLSIFNNRYRNDITGRKAIDPKVLLKIVLFGYSRGLISSRRLEEACKENIVFMAMSCGEMPDHSTIAEFITTMGREIGPVFIQILLICEEEGLLGGTHFSIDGLKLPSNASKEWSGKFEELKLKKEKLEKKVKEVIREHKEEDKKEDRKEKQKDEKKENRIKRLREKIEKIDEFLRENEPREGVSGQEVQSNVTDNESAKMVGSHGIIQGFNANAAVDEKHQVIAYAEAFGESEDSVHTRPMLEGAKKNLEGIGWEEPLKDMIMSADNGYYSISSLETCEEYKVDAYIPDKDFRKRNPDFSDRDKYRRATDRKKTNHKRKKGLFTNEDFKYDEKIGRMICPAGVAMYTRNSNFKTVGGYKGINYQAPKTACRKCNLRTKCLRNPETESRQVYVLYEKRSGLTDRMREKIDSPQGRKTYGKRLAIVEPVFANIRARKRMDRFTLRGLTRVNIQWMLYCIVHNIEKIVNFGESYAGTYA